MHARWDDVPQVLGAGVVQRDEAPVDRGQGIMKRDAIRGS
jgi:hypothetical protein